ncbi:MAG TPA: hypothetical protein VLI69_05590, partial [Gammaproteobacteria bacterium]|nr:hypothetical protein [Gammaproteobacteria bacterium]
LSYYLAQDEYQIDRIPFSFGNMIDGQSAFIFNLDTLFKVNVSVDEVVHVLFHERFHMFQMNNFPAAIWGWKKTDGFNKIENVKLTVLEDSALMRYLETRNAEHLKNYLAISSYRKTLNDPDSYDYEMKKENIEGTADYYGWKMAINNLDFRVKAMIENYKKQCTPDRIINCLIQHRYYFTGNVGAIALDQLDNQWKEKLVQKSQFIRNQLFDHFPMGLAEITQRVTLAKKEYHYNEISKPVAQAIQSYVASRDKVLKQWNAMDGIPFVIARRPCNLYGVIPYRERYYLNSDTWLQIDYNGPSQCADGSIVVNYTHMPLMQETEHNAEIVVKIPRDSVIEINHAAFSAIELLAHDKNYSFKDFYLKTPTIEIAVKNRAGELKIIDGKMELVTDNEIHFLNRKKSDFYG